MFVGSQTVLAIVEEPGTVPLRHAALAEGGAPCRALPAEGQEYPCSRLCRNALAAISCPNFCGDDFTFPRVSYVAECGGRAHSKAGRFRRVGIGPNLPPLTWGGSWPTT